MTVADLISRLKEFPGSMRVVQDGGFSGYNDVVLLKNVDIVVGAYSDDTLASQHQSVKYIDEHNRYMVKCGKPEEFMSNPRETAVFLMHYIPRE